MGTRFNFSSLLNTDMITGKYLRVKYRNGEKVKHIPTLPT